MHDSSSSTIEAWPASLPLPLLDYGGAPLHTTLASKPDNAKILRRSRFSATVVAVSVQWVFGIAEYDAFKSFFLTNLDNGAAMFRIELKYPNTSSLTEWEARFADGYISSYVDGNWMVEAAFDLMMVIPAIVPQPESPLGWVQFVVVEAEDFVDRDGYSFFVKI